MNSSETVDKDDKMRRARILLKRIRELEEICAASLPVLSTEIPVGYTPARWQLALQSFNERLPAFKEQFPGFNSVDDEEVEVEFDIEMGPEWELKCAQKELDELLQE